MRVLKTIIFILTISVASVTYSSPREVIPLNEDWQLRPAYRIRDFEPVKVNLPHTWNVEDVFERVDYSREAKVYQKSLFGEKEWENKRVFLFFEGVNSVATVLLNGNFIGEHRGGYTAFCFEMTGHLQLGKNNKIEVFVSNAFRTDVMPLAGDFNMYGGIHRPVRLIVTNENCISPLDYASSGVYIKQKSISEKEAQLIVNTKLSITRQTPNLQLRTTFYDASQSVVAQQTKRITSGNELQNFNIKNPVLWNGKENSYLYEVKVEVLDNGKLVDEITEKTGFRYFKVDPNNGFFLNGKYLNLYGFGRHEDWKGKGSAISDEDIDTDMALLLESGATSMRLAHYPHRKRVYDLSDKEGIVLWTEIPLVGPGGQSLPGHIDSEAFEEHGRTVLIEMIRQNFNHPSVCFWGLFNELTFSHGDPLNYIKELDALAKQEDNSRLTAIATFLNGDVHSGVADVMGWNKYFGWYGYGRPASDIGGYMDTIQSLHPHIPVGVSEYGAGGSVITHQQPLEKPDPNGKIHPEEWLTLAHELNWQEMSKRSFIWGKYIWNFADFSSSSRTEGDKDGINDKGLITYDRKIKKDAFYFYKANWNPELMVHITNSRFTDRTIPETEVRIFSNMDNVELFVNGKSQGSKKKDELNRIVWENVSLNKGQNEIKAVAKTGRTSLTDTCVWTLK